MIVTPRPRTARARSALRAALACALALLIPASASGDQSDTAEAERLFREARAALDQGRREEACEKFKRSLDLAEVANTVFNVARCEEEGGRVAAALARWQQGIALLGEGDPRLAVAKERVAALERRVPRLTVKLSAGAPPGVRVLLDGAELSSAALTTPLPVEPGEHSLVVEAPGRRPRREPVTLAEGERKEIAVAPGPAEPGPRPSATSTAKVPPPVPDGSGRRTLGFVIGGVGVAGLVTAGVTGGVLLARDADIENECPNKLCSRAGRETIDGNGPLFLVNAIAWGVGVVGVGAGVFLLLMSSDDGGPQAAIAPVALPAGGGLSMRGRF